MIDKSIFEIFFNIMQAFCIGLTMRSFSYLFVKKHKKKTFCVVYATLTPVRKYPSSKTMQKSCDIFAHTPGISTSPLAKASMFSEVNKL